MKEGGPLELEADGRLKLKLILKEIRLDDVDLNNLLWAKDKMVSCCENENEMSVS